MPDPTEPWLDPMSDDAEPAGDRFAKLLARDGILRVPGAHDGMSGLLAKRAGFECLYISGAAISASMGLPDLGIMTMEEICAATRNIARATKLPLIVDGDTGYGEALNVMRLVRELESAGAAAVQIEDQVLPKKCGHLNDKTLVSPQEMAAKVAAAKRAATHLRIIARTDAAADSLSDAIERAKLYVEAGADIIFPEALPDDQAFRHFKTEVDVPLLANMTEFGRTPYRSAEEFETKGYKIVIWPVSSLRVAAKANEQLFAHLAEAGETKSLLDRMQTRSELYETIGYTEFEKLDGSVALSVVPETPEE